jgi:hypothetical protein
MEEERKPRLVQDITADDVRKIKRYENISDEEAEELLFALEKLAIITYNTWQKVKQKENETEQFQTIRKGAA